MESFGYDTGSANPTMVHNMTTLTEPNGHRGPDAGPHLAIAYEESATPSAPLGYVISQTDPAGLGHHLLLRRGHHGADGTTTITDSPHGATSESEDEYLDRASSSPM